ncbi:MAG: ABC transporter ATP-binding protein/permease [Bacilli bacterium]|nr:ABC transporter ATP-binding protein/permease [Bacilli bacterium]
MKNVKRLLRSLRGNKKNTILAIVLVALEVVCECIMPLAIAEMIDSSGVDWGNLLGYGAILIVLATASLLCGIFSGKFSAKAAAGFAKNLREDMFKNIQDYSFSNIDKFSSSSLITRMTTDVNNIQNAFSIIIRIAIRVPLMIIFSLVASFIISPSLAWIFAIAIPILAGLLILIISKATPTFNKVFRKYDTLNSSVQENIDGIRVVKTYVREDYEKKKFSKAADDVCKDFTRGEKIVAWNTPLVNFFMYAASAIISVLGAYIIIGVLDWGSLTTGGLSSLISYGINILSALSMLGMVIVMISMSMASADRVVEVLEESSDIVNPENAVLAVKDGSIDFNDVSFRYKKEGEENVLENVSLHLKNGESLGIIGTTGSGKTTLISLISRLYDVNDGSVEVGGLDVRKYDLVTLRNEVTTVLQKNVLFSGTIIDNMRWGNKDATIEEIKKACEIAQADEFVCSFKDGYNTFLEEGGTNLSGGQKQRLCIARAILRKPKILILDDSTSAVDTKTDALIMKGIKESLPTTTKIVIAQRVSSLTNMDHILVLDNGKINGYGTEAELLQSNSIYKEISQAQRKNGGNENEKQ